MEKKQTARLNVRTNERDERMERAIKTALTALWNSDGGALLIGVVDRTDEVFGIEADARLCGKPHDTDAFLAWLANTILQPLFEGSAPHLRTRVETFADKTACCIDVPRGHHPVYLDDELPVRVINTTNQLAGPSMVDYLRGRFPDLEPPSPPPTASGSGGQRTRTARSRTVQDDVYFLDEAVRERVTRTLRGLVEQAGGSAGRGPIPPDEGEDVLDLFRAWARHYGEPLGDGWVRFGPSPGLWHALQALVPIDDPNRWDKLRKCALQRLEVEGWGRESPPRGSVFRVPPG